MSAHTKEPWRVKPLAVGGIETVDGSLDIGQTFQTVPIPEDLHQKERHANAARIVACVNACAGVPTHMLEMLGNVLQAAAASNAMDLTIKQIVNESLAEVLNETCKERDELLAALKGVMDGSKHETIQGVADWHSIAMPRREALEVARAAIAKVRS